MHIRIVTFTLDGIDADRYADMADTVAPGFTEWPGLEAKFWLADRGSGTYGGVYVFESTEAADESRRSELYRAMVTNPHFADIDVHEFRVLDGPTATTTARLTAATP
jgi:Putative mono-oxygenase ydhR